MNWKKFIPLYGLYQWCNEPDDNYTPFYQWIIMSVIVIALLIFLVEIFT